MVSVMVDAPEFTDNLPKYLQLTHSWRSQIMTGVLRPGDRLPSFARLREEFGATQATVEKAFTILEREGLITREASKGIFVAERTGAVTDKKSKAKKKHHKTIGVSGYGFEFDCYAAYWVELLRGIRQAARRVGMQVLLLDHRCSQGWEKADGVLVCDWTAHDILDHIAPHQPRVSVMVDLPGMASVAPDDTMGGRIATEYLLERGHTKIAYLHGMDVHVLPQRLDGYRNALADAGIIPDGRWTRVLKGFHRNNQEFQKSAGDAMMAWFEKDWERFGFTALLCHNDATAIGAVEALEKRGLRVPDDVSVIGYDGVEEFVSMGRQLTTVKLPLAQIGAQAVEVLLRQIEADEVSNEHHVLPVTIKKGRTTCNIKMNYEESDETK
jgi:DNA-binding LacI/PurR family transcriptional regulator